MKETNFKTALSRNAKNSKVSWSSRSKGADVALRPKCSANLVRFTWGQSKTGPKKEYLVPVKFGAA